MRVLKVLICKHIFMPRFCRYGMQIKLGHLPGNVHVNSTCQLGGRCGVDDTFVGSSEWRSLYFLREWWR